ncbi:hypothetical protein MMC11_003653 [Xylographa trunciseda]|nr:hypothetical protein [Xylographa trunciseda]
MALDMTSRPALTLYRGFPGAGSYVWSPFVTKLEARLRFAGLTYRTEAGSLSQAPRGKIPYLAVTKLDSVSQDPVGPVILADSTLIIQKLEEEGLLDDLNAGLSPVAKAHDLALRALLEEKLYFYQNYERWHENYYTMRPKVLAALPYPVQLVVGLLAYRKITQTLYGQGTMRFSAEEISSFKHQIWENVNALLVESRRKKKKKIETGIGDAVFWVLGEDQPTEADAVLFGFVASGLVCTAGPESQKLIRSFPAVGDYARRIHDRYFPDYICWE